LSNANRTARIDVVWAAGAAGFGANDSEIALEVAAFEEVLAISRAIYCLRPTARHVFHLISSAGGLFEGQRFVTSRTSPAPIRPYGRGKLRQEALLEALEFKIERAVYRLSSVYGQGRAGTRAGLITALLANVVNQRVSDIFGEPSTVRDYVFSEDIGRFIADRIVKMGMVSGMFYLASGKPTSVYEVIHIVKAVTGKSPYLKFDPKPFNTQHITFAPNVLPDGWHPTDLKTGVQKTSARVRLSFADPIRQQMSY
jgi:UDP-glucose 4-epimerase